MDPTAAMVIAYGRIILKVSNGDASSGVKKVEGRPSLGSTDSPPLKVLNIRYKLV